MFFRGTALFSANIDCTGRDAVYCRRHNFRSGNKRHDISPNRFPRFRRKRFLNIYTGECNLNYLSLQNPQAYNMSEYATESNMEIPTFAIAKSVKLRLSPSDLILRGRLVVKSADIDIDVINCVRINSASYNLPEFIEKYQKSRKSTKGTGTHIWKNFL